MNESSLQLIVSLFGMAVTYAPKVVQGGEVVATDISKIVSDLKAKDPATTTIADIGALFEHVATNIEDVIGVAHAAKAPAAALPTKA